MSTSNYEKYAIVKQQELLHKERNLQQAISCLRDRQKFASLRQMTLCGIPVGNPYEVEE